MRHVLILSCLDGLGPTGVDTHMRAAVRIVEEAGGTAEIVHPHGVQTPRLLALRVAQRLAARLALRETTARLVRLGHGWALRVKLARRLTALDGRPVTIYAQDSISSATAGALRRATGARLVTVVHFNRSEAEELTAKDLTVPGGKLYRATELQERRSIAAADRILFVSDFMRQHVLARYGPNVAVKSGMVGLWPEQDIIAATRLARRDLIAIGTLEPRKNQRFLLALLRACVDHGHSVTLTLIGDGPDRAVLEAMAQDLGVAQLVDFRGRIASGQAEIAQHRALIHTALLENMPLTLIEALAHGRPIFCFPFGGMPEIVRDGREGVFLNPDDPAAAAGQVIALLANASRLAAMGAAARARFEAHFAKPVAVKALLAELGLRD